MPQHWSGPARAPSSCQASSTWRSTPIPRAPDNPNQRTLRSADYNGPWLIYIALSLPRICMCVRVCVRAWSHNRKRNRKKERLRELLCTSSETVLNYSKFALLAPLGHFLTMSHCLCSRHWRGHCSCCGTHYFNFDSLLNYRNGSDTTKQQNTHFCI